MLSPAARTRLAAEYGIALREGPQDYKRKGVVERDWLMEEYVHCGRTLPDLAREKNMSTANMTRWAHAHQIPLWPRGAASHDSFLRTTDLPAEIRKALTSPYAAEPVRRSHRPPDAKEAAERIGITQSALVVQINRLDRDIGGPLLERAERGRPMSPTPLGEQVIAVLHLTHLSGRRRGVPVHECFEHLRDRPKTAHGHSGPVSGRRLEHRCPIIHKREQGRDVTTAARRGAVSNGYRENAQGCGISPELPVDARHKRLRPRR